jgi:uncharacterized protein YehS (DUF1456 family)
MISLFALGEYETTRSEMSNWLKKDDVPEQKSLHDKHLAHFLNGLIVKNRGKREGVSMAAEKTLTNNIILKKLKIALNLKSEDVIDILKLADLYISNHELSAFFRKPTQKQYRLCKDQFLRNFLHGLQIKHRPKE